MRIRLPLFLAVLCCILFIPAAQGQFAYPFDQTELKAYYPFDGDADDWGDRPNTPAHNDGVPQGTTDFYNVTPALPSLGSLRLDAAGEYVIVDDQAQLDIERNLTIAAWVRVDTSSLSGIHTIVSKDFATGETNYNLHIMDGEVAFAFTNGVNALTPGSAGFSACDSGGCVFTGSTTLAAGTWYHVAATYDFNWHEDGFARAKIFVNGALDATMDVIGSDADRELAENNQDLWIGTRKYDPAGNAFSGLIDELRIYKKALTNSEVRLLSVRGSLSGGKFYDLDLSGSYSSPPDLPVEDFKIRFMRENFDINDLADDQAIRRTDSNGEFSLPFFAGTYTIDEYTTGYPWISTYPDPPVYENQVITTEGQEIEDLLFGNVCLGPAETPYMPHSKGFWHNKNGAELITPADVVELADNWNLKTDATTAFNPTSVSQLQAFLKKDNSRSPYYRLSVQLAAMVLNIRHGLVDPTVTIYAPGTGSADALGFATIADLINEAHAALGSASTDPDLLHDLTMALDQANNNYNYVQDEPCAIVES